MAHAELMLDIAAYNQALRQARQALQAPGRTQPLPPGCLVGARPSGWYPGLGNSPLDGQPMTAAPLASSSQSLNLEGSHPSPFPEGLSPQATTPPGRPVSSSSTEQIQPSSSLQLPPWDLSQSSSVRPPAFMPAMVSLLETLAPYSSQVPNSNFDSILNHVIRTYPKGY